MTRSLSFATSAPLSSLVVGLVVTAASAQQVVGPPAPAKPPPEPTIDSRNSLYSGTVTEVTKTSISIRWSSDDKPKKFSVSETLAAGKVPIEARAIAIPNQKVVPGRGFVPPQFMYRLTDVKVGDLVAIFYAHLGEEDICDHICIQKRPEGRVPPLPEEAEKLLNPAEIVKSKLPPGAWRPDPNLQYIPYHERKNAYWDLEDKGIPYPEKFGRDRRFPIAPMPRDVSITGPRISP